MTDAILTLNMGSSSLKSAVYAVDGDVRAPLWTGRVEAIGPAAAARTSDGGETPAPDAADEPGALDWLCGELAARGDRWRIRAVGHRIVHGGVSHAKATRIDDHVLSALKALSSLAPKHQPYNLLGVEKLRAAFPDALAIGCFDTAFHRTMPRVERLFALPRRYAEEGVLRYGFHGLSYAHIARVLPDHLGAAATGRVVVGHLGHGVSLCAMHEGKSVATTMGFTALDGPPMGARCGAIDPGVLLHLLNEGMGAEALEDLLYNRSGLYGVSQVSGDMRTLLESDDPRACEAVDLFVWRVAREIGALAATLGGLDALVFTAGIGENAVPVRGRICERARWLGVDLDPAANAEGGPRISRPGASVSAWVIPTDEEGEIARETRAML